jgi:uncharacterized membrane protein YbhN (UPF0104 family)
MKRIPELYDIYRKNWRLSLAGLAVSFLMLGAYFSSYYCGLRAVGGDTSFGTVMSAMPVIDAISGMPVSIAGVGVREKLFEVLLKRSRRTSLRKPRWPPRSPASPATPCGRCSVPCFSSKSATASPSPNSKR